MCLALCCCIILSVSLNIIADSDGDSVAFLLHLLVAIFEFEQEEYFVNETEILLVCLVLTNDVVIANQIILSLSSMDGSATGTYVTSQLYVHMYLSIYLFDQRYTGTQWKSSHVHCGSVFFFSILFFGSNVYICVVC